MKKDEWECSKEIALACDDQRPQHFDVGDEADVCGAADQIIDVLFWDAEVDVEPSD